MSTPLSPACLVRRVVRELRLFFIALQFFTRVPIPRWVGFEPGWLHHAARYFPAVGMVVGVATALVYAGAVLLWPPLVAVLLSTIAGIYLTGAFHEDGFADCCDGFGGAMTPARVLEIMKDSRIGAYGAIGIGLMLGLKASLLVALPVHSVIGALLLAHPLSRLASVSLIWRLNYVKDVGKAKPVAQHMATAEFAIAAATILLLVSVLGVGGILSWTEIASSVMAAAVATVWFARLFVRRIGGYTGDCLGAVQQASEVAIYMAVVALMSNAP